MQSPRRVAVPGLPLLPAARAGSHRSARLLAVHTHRCLNSSTPSLFPFFFKMLTLTLTFVSLVSQMTVKVVISPIASFAFPNSV